MRGTPDDLDYFWTLDSRNKESLAIDLKRPEARAALATLIRKADVFITNYPFPVRERLRLRAEDVMHLNERLIYASLTPYGEHGPERDRTGYDTTAWWARSGLMDMVRASPDTERALSMPGMGDHPTAMGMYSAIVTALYRRQITGKGGQVATSLLANGLWSNSCQVQASLCGYELTGRPPRGQRGAMGETYVTLDERAFILTTTNPARDWPLLARAVGHPEWLEEPIFATPADRFANQRILVARLDEIFGGDTWEAWRVRLDAGGVTFGIVGQVGDHIADPQIEANALLPEFADGYGLRTVDSPFHIEGETKSAPRMAPAIGQHSRQILEECGLSAEEIEALAG
jgi:formyl-CoA transferase